MLFPKIKIKKYEVGFVAGSRKVVKDPTNKKQNHFYEFDLWSSYGEQIADQIPAGFIVYGELVGWTDEGTPIQARHTYGLPEGEQEFYVYRVAHFAEGQMVDLSWDQVRNWATSHGFKHVPELWRGYKREFDLEQFREVAFYDNAVTTAKSPYEYIDVPVPLSADNVGADEGIAIRIDGADLSPELYKYKNESHYLHETALLDEGVLDMEAGES